MSEASTLQSSPLLGHVKFGRNETATNADLIDRREDVMAGSFLFYHDPIHLTRGRDVWLFDDKGRRYLDCYNNVPSVGHAHPRIVKALWRQAGTLNTHTRYLSQVTIDYAEKLAASFPKGLDVCLFTCTGTEANELAMRIARTVTGNNGAIVMENAYHGNSTLIGEMSTATYDPARRPAHVATVEPPDLYHGPYRETDPEAGRKYGDLVDVAIRDLRARGENVAAFMCDAIFDSQGALEAPKDYFQHVYAKVRAAGGLCIADEVQPGFCRTGTWWGFENYGAVPDIVTLGKPMGAGHPVAGVVVSHEIAEAWKHADVYFNTFGGNPVSAAVGGTVLDIIKDEHIRDNVQRTGAYLRSELERLQQKHSLIGNVRGLGLFQAVELVTDRATRTPAPEIARLVPDMMKREGVLMGLSGRYGSVLKVRPPLTFKRHHVDHLIRVLDKVLGQVGLANVAPEQIHVLQTGLLSETMLAQLATEGVRKVLAGRGVVMTPLARERARALNIQIDKTQE